MELTVTWQIFSGQLFQLPVPVSENITSQNYLLCEYDFKFFYKKKIKPAQNAKGQGNESEKINLPHAKCEGWGNESEIK